MIVYVLSEYYAEDYSTGGETILGIFATRDGALAEAAKHLPKVMKKPEAESWNYPKEPAAFRSLSIQEWEVQGVVAGQ